MIEMKLTGMDALLRELHELPAKLERKAFTNATRAGAKVVVDEAKQSDAFKDRGKKYGRYAHRVGNLRKSIKVYKARGKKGEVTFYAGVIGGKKKDDAYYARWVERGHAIGKKGRKGKGSVGQVPAHPFLRPAFDNNRQKILDAISARVRTEIDKAKL